MPPPDAPDAWAGDPIVAASVIAAAILGLVSYIVVHVLTRYADKRRWHLARLDMRLDRFYGPFAQLTRQTKEAYGAHLLSCPKIPTTPEEQQRWMIWMRSVLMPQNLRIEQLFTTFGYLCDPKEDTDIERPMAQLHRHNAFYQHLIERWATGDTTVLYNDASQHPELDYPPGLDAYAAKLYEHWKGRRDGLLGRLT